MMVGKKKKKKKYFLFSPTPGKTLSLLSKLSYSPEGKDALMPFQALSRSLPLG